MNRRWFPTKVRKERGTEEKTPILDYIVKTILYFTDVQDSTDTLRTRLVLLLQLFRDLVIVSITVDCN